jgi:uncharacterized protein YkwD
MYNKINLLLASTLLLTGNSVLAFDYGNPTAKEQAHLEEINRARLNPTAEAARFNFNLFEGTEAGAISGDPVQPLSSNAQLLQATRAHSADMLARNFFAHDNPDGESPFDRMRKAGYSFQTAGENIAFHGTTGSIDETLTSLQLHEDLFVDEDFPDRGHRVSILNPDFKEVGVGLAFGSFTQDGTRFNSGMISTDFGSRSDSLPILLGVVYDDGNNDQFYNVGEGVDAIKIEVAETSDETTTASAGGYGLELPENSDYSITFSHPEFGAVTKNIHINQSNIKLDALLSEFSDVDNPPPSQCATFNNNQLTLPCVIVNNDAYSASLSVANNNPLQFVLDSAKKINQDDLKQCATYQLQILQVELPCVDVGENNYWANLRLIQNNPSLFKLESFGLN